MGVVGTFLVNLTVTLCLCILKFGFISGQNVNLNDSPCPNIFKFGVNGNELVGYLTVYFPKQTVNTINVEFEIETPETRYGALNLMDNEQKVGYDIINNKPVNYKLEFPRWTTQPRITKIYRNNELICTGPPIQSYTKKMVTLKNTFYLGIHQTNSQNPINTPAMSDFLEANIPSQIFNSEDENFDIHLINEPTSGGNFFIPTHHNRFNHESTTTTRRPITQRPSRLPFTTMRPTQTRPPSRVKPIEWTTTTATMDVQTTTDTPVVSNQACGVAFESHTNHLIYGGKSFNKGEYPWLGAMFVKQTRTGWDYQCMGNLVSRKHLITAAHCCEHSRTKKSISPTDMIFALGLYDLKSFSTEKGSVNMDVQQIWPHIEYKYGIADADIAIIVLQREVEVTNFIRPICIWAPEFGDSMRRLEKQKGTIAGWGRTETQDLGNIPTAVSLPVVSNEDCLRSNPAYATLTSNRSFCAGELNNKGPCNGDSGSGFMISRNSVWYLRGVVSVSLRSDATGYCDLNSYVVFTDVVRFRSWIKKITGGII